ncbi:DUF1611 domain-containing protein [Wenzhouxiangella sp. XN201]|uniref:DUF1611 domain-containing protein n=1 Tax=Wenzhouxiangella sp. XN201 TaxID=2710755 RepID=UPI0013C8FFCC|nr:DUF1611 domain-containing protein [Wenzhouxiangella sp. XN201]NEZ04975.1 DUF1611 domain-containing protein [Wenzhouxiangella sp. XN201]
MSSITRVRLKPPYLLLIGAETDPTFAKTAQGIVQWCPDKVAGQLRFEGSQVDLGVSDMSLTEAVEAGCGSLVLGVAPVGGAVPESWWEVIEQAARAGLDIVSGLHLRLRDRPGLAEVAEAAGAQLVDVRVPPAKLPVGNGKPRTGRRILTVGPDCAIGKKYTALALDHALREAGEKSTYRATGQTGIMIAGEGIPIDSVVADFISGAAELLSPDNDPDHFDVIEGQGSIFHPGYSGVALGLLHGSQPDGFVVCHDPLRKTVSGWPHYSLPPLAEVIEAHIRMGRRTSPDIRCVGVSVNTSKLPADERAAYLDKLAEETGLPCVDPLIDGCNGIVEHLLDTLGRSHSAH